jgi:hypothetical protein
MESGQGSEAVVAEFDVGVIVRDPVTGLFGFRLELGRDRTGVRLQASPGVSGTVIHELDMGRESAS